MKIFQRLRILPVLVLVAFLCLLVRAGEFAAGLEKAGAAFAQQEAPEAVPPPLPAVPTEENKEDQAVMGPVKAPAEEEAAAGAGGPEKIEWQDATEAEFDYSQVREDLYKDLAARRRELDEREKVLTTREALLEAAERELDQKIREMTAVRNEIESLMREQSEEELKRVQSLVKIYEGMKPKDAARIFNTLDMDVLIAVMARMSERKSAPILAEMNPERARSVTILLAQQKQLPAIPPQ